MIDLKRNIYCGGEIKYLFILFFLVIGQLFIVSNNCLQAQDYYSDIYCIPTTSITNSPSLYLYNPYYLNQQNNNGMVIADLGKKKASSESVKRESDDSTASDRIIKISQKSSDYYEVEIELTNYDRTIDISIYNILMKKVLNVFNGKPSNNITTYGFDTSRLPNGFYFCVLSGSNLRRSVKLEVAR